MFAFGRVRGDREGAKGRMQFTSVNQLGTHGIGEISLALEATAPKTIMDVQ